MEEQNNGESENPQHHRWIIYIILSELFVFGLIVAGLSIYIWQRASQLAKTAIASTETRVANDANATSTHIARNIERASFGFIDQFNDNHNNWFTGPRDDEYFKGDTRVDGGTYVWDITEAKRSFIYWGRINTGVLYSTDFDLYVDARRLQGISGTPCYGLQFRTTIVEPQESYYAYIICDSGYFQVLYYDGKSGNWTTLHDWEESYTIRANYWNTLGVIARGTRLTFLINDYQVAKLEDAHLSAGEVGVLIDMTSGESGSVQFDDFRVQEKLP